jgi:hypothetical protein
VKESVDKNPFVRFAEGNPLLTTPGGLVKGERKALKD